MQRRFLALMLILPTLALAACGGDDESQDQGSQAPDTTATTPDAASGEKGQDGQASDSNRNADGDRRSRGDSGGSSGERQSAERRQSRRVRRVLERTRRQAKRREQRAKRRARRVVEQTPQRPPPTSTDRATYNTAKKVCGEFLTAEYVEQNDPQQVARTYATPWPENRRDAAYEGCLAGLKLPRAPAPPDEER